MPETVTPLLSVPKLVIVFWVPVTFTAWLMTPPCPLVIELMPPPETVTPLLSVPKLVIVFWVPVTLKVWLMVAPL